MNNQISEIDKNHYEMIRKNVGCFLEKQSNDLDNDEIILLDVAPQIHEGARAFFRKCRIETLDIDPSSNASYIADLCRDNTDIIPSCRFDIIVCTEVLEHTLDPFSAIREMHRILKQNGTLLLSVPFNFRIHGPLPDCWRFTEHGLRQLLKDFRDVQIYDLPTEDRWLMPIQYTVRAQK